MRPLKVFWYILMVALFLAGRLTGRREFFLLLFIMGFVILYSLVLNLWTIFSFSYGQEVDKRICVKGSETSMLVEIYNEKPFPFAFMRLTTQPVARSQRVMFSFSLISHSSISFTVPLPCPYRGNFGVGITELEVNDSFGLMRNRFNMFSLPYYKQVKLKVYPRLAELSILPAKRSDNKNYGNASQRYIDHGESYAGLRKYRPGDPLKRIHPAVSAKRRELYVKTYDTPFETSVLIALDTFMKCETEEDSLYLSDLACECAVAIAHYSLKTGHRVVLSCDSTLGTTYTFESMKNLTKLYDILSELEFNEKSDFIKILQRPLIYEMQSVYVISARRGSNIFEVFTKLYSEKAKFIELVTRRNARSLSDGNASQSIFRPGIWTVQMAVGDDVASVLSEEVDLL